MYRKKNRQIQVEETATGLEIKILLTLSVTACVSFLLLEFEKIGKEKGVSFSIFLLSSAKSKKIPALLLQADFVYKLNPPIKAGF